MKNASPPTALVDSGQLATQPAQNDASQVSQQPTLKDPKHSNAVATHDVTAVHLAHRIRGTQITKGQQQLPQQPPDVETLFLSLRAESHVVCTRHLSLIKVPCFVCVCVLMSALACLSV